MSSIKSAVSTVKNFLVSWISPLAPVGQGGVPAEEEHTSRFASGGFYSTGISGSRKRPAAVFEPEITDDEDDWCGPSFNPTYSFPAAKRPRDDFGINFMNFRYGTRGSGSTPHIEGLPKQPWEFNFKSKAHNGASSRLVSAGATTTTLTSEKVTSTVPAKEAGEPSGSQSMPRFLTNLCCGSSRSAKNDCKEEHLNKATGSNQEIEVITLDDEPLTTASSGAPSYNVVKSQAGTHAVRYPGRNEIAAMKPRLALPMRASKTKDANKFTKCLKQVGQKLLQTSYYSSATRHSEMQRYKDLLALHGLNKSMALSKTKVNTQELQAIYNKFGPSDGSVTFSSNIFTEPGKYKSVLSSRAVSVRDEHLPRLYSPLTSNHQPSSSPKPISRKLLAVDCPEVIDLESDKVETVSQSLHPDDAKRLPPIPSESFTESVGLASSSRPDRSFSIAGNYSNLEDALNSTGVVLKYDGDDEIDDISEAATSTRGDDDLTILAENIVSRSRSRSINSLALEQTSCPYVDKRWLNDSKCTWRENKKQREDRIRECEATIDIIKRESTLDADIEERIRKKLVLTEIIVLEEPPVELPELTNEMLDIISHAKTRGFANEVLAQVKLLKDTIAITRGDIGTLGPSQWLNDNVINTYMGLIVLRSKQDNFPSVYAFQTFFYPKLLKEGYSNSLKRWTRKDDIFAHDLLIFPIHLGLHWCLACVDFRQKTINYYDSLGGENKKCLNSLLEYLCKEMKERKQTEFPIEEWTLDCVQDIPQQKNGSDCGMFACKFAEYLSRDKKFTFTQADMPYYRDRMIYELLRENLMSP